MEGDADTELARLRGELLRFLLDELESEIVSGHRPELAGILAEAIDRRVQQAVDERLAPLQLPDPQAFARDVIAAARAASPDHGTTGEREIPIRMPRSERIGRGADDDEYEGDEPPLPRSLAEGRHKRWDGERRQREEPEPDMDEPRGGTSRAWIVGIVVLLLGAVIVAGVIFLRNSQPVTVTETGSGTGTVVELPNGSTMIVEDPAPGGAQGNVATGAPGQAPAPAPAPAQAPAANGQPPAP